MVFNRRGVYATAAAALIVAGGGALTLHSRGDLMLNSASATAAKSQPAATEIDVAAVVATTITDYQEYSGRIEAIDHVNVRPQVPGEIVAIHFKDGALVKSSSE